VTNNAGATFHLTHTKALFNGPVFDYGTWITDPSTLTFTKGFTVGTGGTLQAAGDTYIFQGSGLHFNLNGTGTIGTLQIAEGSTLDLTGTGSLYVSVLLGLTFSNGTVSNLKGSSGFHLYYDPSQNPLLGGNTIVLSGGGELLPGNPVPLPGALWLFGPGLVGLAAMRRRFKK